MIEPVSPVFSEILVHDNIEASRADWLELAGDAAISPYQSFAFLSAWCDTVGRAEQITPFIIVARDRDGRPCALLPLGVVKAGVRIALFLGGRESNFNLPVLRRGAGHDGASLRALLMTAARLAPEPPDLFYLRNQPRRFDNVVNPLVLDGAQPSASRAFGAMLPARVDELAARFSRDARKKLRRKEARLSELGRVAYEHQATGARGGEIVAVLLRQKAARFDIADAFSRCDIPQLLERLRAHAGDGAIELHALSVGERIVATYAGVVRGGRFSAMLNSYEADPPFARCSPGELLLHALMRDLVARGFTHFDLGAGEARYKRQVCDETIDLYDVILPVSPRAAAAAPLLSAFLSLKRRVKRTPALAKAYYGLKRLIGR